MRQLIVTIVAVFLVGCGEPQQTTPPQTDTKPTEPDTDVAKSEPSTAKETDYSGKYTLSIAERGMVLNFELKPDGSFFGKSSMDEGDDLIGSWKVEGELLVSEGTSEKSSQVIIVKFNKKTGKVESMIEGNEIPIKDQIPEGEDGLYFKKEVPFNSVYFNGLIRDEKGKKMSKSLGNSPDPINLMDKYGADALRVGLLLIAPQGLDILFSEDKIEHGRNFMNKVWNSARFVEMNIDDDVDSDLSAISEDSLDPTDRWILSKLNSTILEVNSSYSSYRMNDAVKSVYDFVYKNFCDWYIEFSKSRFYGDNDKDKIVAQKVCLHVLETILKLMHPYCPFITEEIWSHYNHKEMLINAAWPELDKNKIDNKIENELSIVMKLISSIRNIKANFSISPKKEIDLFCKVDDSIATVLKSYKIYLERLVKVTNLETGIDIEKPSQSTTIVFDNIEVYIPLKDLIDIDKEMERLNNQIENLNGRLNSINRKLDNQQFVSNAPEEIVAHEQNKKSRYENELKILQNNLNSLK